MITLNSKSVLLLGIFLFIIASLSGCSRQIPEASYVSSIKGVMQEQSNAWNNGDLEAYMAPYWRSDSLVFIGKNGLTYGWDKTLQNYRKGYPTPEAMGKLSFNLLKFEALSKDAVFVIGKWHLARSMGDLQGHFSLVFRKIEGKWKIVADHSS